MKFLFAYLLCLLIGLPVLAQLNVTKRIDLEINPKRGSNYRVMPLGSTGLLTFFESEESLRSFKKEVIITKYDTELQVQWAHSYALENESNLNIYAMQGDWLYFLLPKLEKNYEFLKLNTRSGQLELIKYDKIVEMDVTHFAVMNEVFYLGGMVNGSPVVIHFDHQLNKPKVLPGINQLKATINRIDTDPPSNTMSVILTSEAKKKASFYYNVYDVSGKLMSNYVAPTEQDYHLFTFRPYYVSQNEQLLFGMYSVSAKDKAQGVYVARIKNNEMEQIKVYDFSYLKNFFNYLQPKKKDKLLLKIKDKRQDGQPTRYDYNFFVRDLQFVNDKIVFIAESYVPIFADGSPNSNFMRNSGYPIGFWMNTPWAMMPNGFSYNANYDPFSPRSGQNANRSPVGYRFKHAIVCAFDQQGKLLWDNSYEYKDLESSQPDQFVQVATDGEAIRMMHFQENKLYWKTTKRSIPVDSLQAIEIPAKEIAEKTVSERDREQVQYWFGDYFLLHGIQELKNTTSATSGSTTPERRKKVFYLAKLTPTSPTVE